MKKAREFLLLLALLAFTALPVVAFLFWPERRSGLPVFAGRWEYFKLMISDAIFLSAVGRAVAWMLALCGLTAVAGGILLWRLKKRFPPLREVVYVVTFFLFLIVTLSYITVQSWGFGSNLTWILALQCSALALLLVWIVEQAAGAIRQKSGLQKNGP